MLLKAASILAKNYKTKKMTGNALSLLFGRGLSLTCQAAYIVLLGQLLGSKEYGIYMGVLAMVSLVSPYSTFGTNSVLIRYVSNDQKQFPSYWGNSLVVTSVLGMMFTLVFAGLGRKIAPSCSTLMITCIAAADCVFMQITTSAAAVFQSFEKMSFTAILNTMTNLFRLLLTVVLVAYAHHISAVIWSLVAMLVSIVSGTLSLYLVIAHFGMPKFLPSLLKKRFKEGIVFSISDSTGNIYNDIDKTMMLHYGMNAENGVYSLAYKIINACMMPILAIHGALFPLLFREGFRGVDATKRLSLKIIRVTAPLNVIISILIWLIAPYVSRLIGPSFYDAASALRWLCLLPFFRAVQWSSGDALTGAGYQSLRLYMQIIVSIFNFLSNLYLIPHYGWIGAAWASLATDGILGVLNWVALLTICSQERKEYADSF